MKARGSDYRLRTLLVVVIGGFLLAATAVVAGNQDESGTQRIPKQVREALMAKFPKAEVDKWSREKESGNVVFDIEFRQNGRKFEADIRENGSIDNWEKEITAESLPGAVAKVVKEKYPGSTLREIMEITAVKSGKDEREGYEIVLETTEGKRFEITVAPDGRILEEDSGEEE